MSTSKKRFAVYLVMIISLFVSVKLVKEIIRLKSADERIIEAEEELMLVKQEQAELKKLLAETEDKSWWEKQVRNVLKMAKPGEAIVVVPEEVVKQTGEKGEIAIIAEEENLSNMQKWWRVLIN